MINNSPTDFPSQRKLNHQQLESILQRACKKIAPVWPLENFVAVNPFLGLTDKKFEQVAKELTLTAGVQMTLPSSFYLDRFEEGVMELKDVADVLSKKQSSEDPSEFLRKVKGHDERHSGVSHVLTVADVAMQVTKKDWNRFITARISNWAAAYFDTGQAKWASVNQESTPYVAWKEEARADLSPELSGLKAFRKTVKALPDHPLDAIQLALMKLDIPEDGIDIYLHRLLLRVGGWSAHAARLDWDSQLYGGNDKKLIEFLAVLICWEVSLLDCLQHPELKHEWKAASRRLSSSRIQKRTSEQLSQKLILQEAFDLAVQRNIIHKFQGIQAVEKTEKQPKIQAIFCIDVRSEIFRRNLEQVNNAIETLGFAGFFAFPVRYVPIGHINGEAQCPVLLKTGPTILEEIPDQVIHQKALNGRLLYRQFQQIWKSFRTGAVTCFSFVSPLGLSYLPKLLADSFGLARPVPDPHKVGLKKADIKMKQVRLDRSEHGDETAGIPLEQQIQMAKNALNAMSLTDDFASLVLIVGHGSTMVNNPHATGYDCGACGGHTGEVNARVAATVLNNRAVRAGLQKENIFIPVNTLFLACLHDTTTDEVTIFNSGIIPSDRQAELNELEESLKKAGQITRNERMVRLDATVKSNTDKSIFKRSKDWSQTRPEWGLAGCSTFVVAPRERTRGIDFGGRSFLHTYEWEKDKNFSVLELIMTAPMVVTSWISLQYYASTVDNQFFGSGNKTLHNVTAGIGVIEGYSGDLRVGLPWQAVHDGERFQHDPVRLNVIIEAPIEAINMILIKHRAVQDLCDNGWLHLLVMDENGKVSHRYEGKLCWEKIEQKPA